MKDGIEREERRGWGERGRRERRVRGKGRRGRERGGRVSVRMEGRRGEGVTPIFFIALSTFQIQVCPSD